MKQYHFLGYERQLAPLCIIAGAMYLYHFLGYECQLVPMCTVAGHETVPLPGLRASTCTIAHCCRPCICTTSWVTSVNLYHCELLQAMYLYYFLGYEFHVAEPLSRVQLQDRADSTYLLTLDGDVDFEPKAVILLLDRMRRDNIVGAVCGRIHPMGSGEKHNSSNTHYLSL